MSKLCIDTGQGTWKLSLVVLYGVVETRYSFNSFYEAEILHGGLFQPSLCMVKTNNAEI